MFSSNDNRGNADNPGVGPANTGYQGDPLINQGNAGEGVRRRSSNSSFSNFDGRKEDQYQAPGPVAPMQQQDGGAGANNKKFQFTYVQDRGRRRSYSRHYRRSTRRFAVNVSPLNGNGT